MSGRDGPRESWLLSVELQRCLNVVVLPRLSASDLGNLACTCTAFRKLIQTADSATWQQAARQHAAWHPICNQAAPTASAVRAALRGCNIRQHNLARGRFDTSGPVKLSAADGLDIKLQDDCFCLSPDGAVMAYALNALNPRSGPFPLEQGPPAGAIGYLDLTTGHTGTIELDEGHQMLGCSWHPNSKFLLVLHGKVPAARAQNAVLSLFDWQSKRCVAAHKIHRSYVLPMHMAADDFWDTLRWSGPMTFEANIGHRQTVDLQELAPHLPAADFAADPSCFVAPSWVLRDDVTLINQLDCHLGRDGYGRYFIKADKLQAKWMGRRMSMHYYPVEKRLVTSSVASPMNWSPSPPLLMTSPDGQSHVMHLLATQDSRITRTTLSTGKLLLCLIKPDLNIIHRLDRHWRFESVVTWSWSPDSRYVALGSQVMAGSDYSGNVAIFDTQAEQGEPPLLIVAPYQNFCLAWTPDGARLLMIGCEDAVVWYDFSNT